MELWHFELVKFYHYSRSNYSGMNNSRKNYSRMNIYFFKLTIHYRIIYRINSSLCNYSCINHSIMNHYKRFNVGLLEMPQNKQYSQCSVSILIVTLASRMNLPPSTLTFSIFGVLSTTLVSRFCNHHKTPI